MVSSPLARARETSFPLAQTWGVPSLVEERVGEIPSPPGDQSERVEWLRVVMRDRWSNLGRDLQTWRAGVIEGLCALERDTVVFTHFIAINAAVGTATGDDRVVCFWPDNGSVTTLALRDRLLTLVERGEEAFTQVR
jgi:broad specificity phosphatase PhoE